MVGLGSVNAMDRRQEKQKEAGNVSSTQVASVLIKAVLSTENPGGGLKISSLAYSDPYLPAPDIGAPYTLSE